MRTSTYAHWSEGTNPLNCCLSVCDNPTIISNGSHSCFLQRIFFPRSSIKNLIVYIWNANTLCVSLLWVQNNLLIAFLPLRRILPLRISLGSFGPRRILYLSISLEIKNLQTTSQNSPLFWKGSSGYRVRRDLIIAHSVSLNLRAVIGLRDYPFNSIFL